MLQGLGGFQKQHRDLPGALATFTKVTDHFHKHPPQTDRDKDTLASVLHGRADCVWLQGSTDGVRELYEQSLHVRRSVKKPSPIELAKTTSNLAVLALQGGALEQAENYASAAFDLAVESQDGSNIVGMGKNLAVILVHRGKHDEAVDLLAQLHKDFAAAVGPKHALTLELEQELYSLQPPTSAEPKEGPMLAKAAPLSSDDTKENE